MKCLILFSGENKKNIINLLSAQLIKKRVVKINEILVFCGSFQASILTAQSSLHNGKANYTFHFHLQKSLIQ